MSKLTPYVVVLWLACFVACTTASEIDTPTQVILRLACSDEMLLRQMTELEVRVSTLEGEKWRVVAPLSLSAHDINWPLDVPIYPRRGSDESRAFEVIVRALRSGVVLAETRGVGHFLRGRHITLERELYLCPGHEPGFVCGEANCQHEDCSVCTPNGGCEPAPALDNVPDAQVADSGTASENDATTSPEGGADANVPDGSGADLDVWVAPDASLDGAQLVDAEGPLPSKEAGPHDGGPTMNLQDSASDGGHPDASEAGPSDSAAQINPEAGPSDSAAQMNPETGPTAQACAATPSYATGSACGRCTCAKCGPEIGACYASADPSRNAHCATVQACDEAAHCVGSDCYCGDSPLCLNPNGACRLQVEAAAGTTNALDVQRASSDANTALGRAMSVGSCALANCRAECGF